LTSPSSCGVQSGRLTAGPRRWDHFFFLMEQIEGVSYAWVSPPTAPAGTIKRSEYQNPRECPNRGRLTPWSPIQRALLLRSRCTDPLEYTMHVEDVLAFAEYCRIVAEYPETAWRHWRGTYGGDSRLQAVYNQDSTRRMRLDRYRRHPRLPPLLYPTSIATARQHPIF